MDRKIGLFSDLALRSASSPQGYQSTGLNWCWRRYGLVSPVRWLGRWGMGASRAGPGAAPSQGNTARSIASTTKTATQKPRVKTRPWRAPVAFQAQRALVLRALAPV